MTEPTSWGRVSIALAAVASAATLGGCGSAAKPLTSSASKSYESFLHFSECMRSHGVPSFPDPGSSGGGDKIGVGLGANPQSPAFQAAEQSCRKLLPGGGPPRVVPESVKLALLHHAECMRAHGVPDYPDPTFPPGGGVESFIGPTSSVSSPAFQSAAKACHGP